MTSSGKDQVETPTDRRHRLREHPPPDRGHRVRGRDRRPGGSGQRGRGAMIRIPAGHRSHGDQHAGHREAGLTATSAIGPTAGRAVSTELNSGKVIPPATSTERYDKTRTELSALAARLPTQ